jgi:hypothetical protein
MRMFGFNAPHVKMAPKFWTAQMNYSHANVGRFLRNTVLDGKTYGSGDLVPAYLKTADLVHPLCGAYNSTNEPSSVYGSVTASTTAGVSVVMSIIQHEKPDAVWTPGGNGLNHWFAVALPEPDLADRYHVRCTAASAPLSWKLQGSLDGSAWTDLHVVDSTGVWASGGETKEFTIPEESRGNFLWYKLLITASNATTMSIYRFRLLRPVAVCPRNKVLLDASASNPLVLSFADGFDGGSPVDHVETISSPQVIDIHDDLLPTSGGIFDLYAVRSPSGGVTIEPVYYNGPEAEILSGGMMSYVDRGFKCEPATGMGYMHWGRGYVSTSAVHGGYSLSRVDGMPFYVTRLLAGYWDDGGIAYCDINTGGGYFRYATAPSSPITNYNLNIGFAVYGIRCGFNYAYEHARLFTAGSRYRHRMIGGVLYQLDINDINQVWTPVQKIKLATVRKVSGLEDVTNVIPKSTLLSQWQVDGDLTDTTLDM